MLCDAERDRLIKNNLRLVEKIAAGIRQSMSPPMEFEELVAYGTQGLVEAAGRWDPAHGARFTTFAHYRIRGAIIDGLRRQGWFGKQGQVQGAAGVNSYLGNLARRPTAQPRSSGQRVQDLARTLGDLATIMVTSYHASGCQEPADTRSRDSFEALAEKRVQQSVLRALGRLPDRERRLIELHYYQDLTLARAGEQLGLSRSWASRLHARAINLLTGELEQQRQEE